MKKGFTLIELLAVIIILAVVAIIATPIVLNIVNDAKESTAKSQAYLILDGARNYYAESIFDNNKKNKIDNLGNIYDDIEMSGKKPENGKLYVNSKGLTAMAVVINNKCYKKEFGGELQIIDESDCELGYVGDDQINPTVEFNVVGNPFNENDWANTDFYVSINVIDNESGAYSYKWCSGINDCEPLALVEESNGNVLISTESDNNVVCAIGYDKAGNMSDKTCSESYKLDKTNPVLEGISDLIVDKDDIVDLTLDVIATDSLSGIDGTYSYDPTSVDTSVAGTTNITYSVSDKAGNEVTITRKIIVDTEAPTVTYTDLGDKINANGWSKEDFFVEALLVDRSGLGISSAKWCSTTNDTCEPVADMVGSSMTPLISTESNNNRICIKATDNNDKTSEIICSDSYKLDKTNPIAGTINVTGTSGSNDWYTSNVTISSTNGSDSLSGHDTTTVDISSITSNTIGTTVTLTTIDQAGNTSTVTRIIKVDKNVPVVTPTGSSITITQGDSNQASSYFTTSYSISSGTLSCNPINTSSLAAGNREVSCTATGGNGLTTTATKTITVQALEYADNSGANKPELHDKMIPVKHNGTNWVYADKYDEWYDYDNKEWANAVVLNNGVTKSVGQNISESEIAMMFVWIPRYKYTIFNGNNGSAPVQEINIVFESGTAKTGTVTCTAATSGSGSSSETCSTITNGVSTYTHPAFTFGTQELTGIWVGKFENSTTDTSCNTNQNESSCSKVLPVTIKPNVRSWRYANVSNFYTSIGNISNNYEMNVDSHMMKNMEWGAVAYLTQSKYGRCDNGVCTEISKNNSSNFYTGRSLGRPSSASGEYSSSGTYTYEQPLGQLASTTGNIYGIYDMSGGSWEYVMGNMVNSSNQFYSSNAGFSTNPITKYYDSYTYGNSSYTTHSRGRLGDATKETLQNYGSGSGGWYDDYAYFPYSTYAWFFRGGNYGGDARAGVFSFDYNAGDAVSDRAARVVVVSADDN